MRTSSSSEVWFDHFRTNRDILDRFPAGKGCELTEVEKTRIWDSIREFQLGESSEGRNLSAFARSYAELNHEPLYYECIKRFIREEQRHSQVLGLYMESEGIPEMKQCFVDSVFRGLRRHLGLEVSITVLLVAEIISLAYYRALRSATGSRTLKAICSELLRDEKAHLRFHGERLALLRKDKAPLRNGCYRFLQDILVAGTCFAVWNNHRKVLRSRQSFPQFWRSVWAIDRGMEKRIKDWSGSATPSEKRARTPWIDGFKAGVN
jgi:hypothetical protein